MEELPKILPATYSTQRDINRVILPDLSQQISATRSWIQESLTSLLSIDTYPQTEIERLIEVYVKLLRLESRQALLDKNLKLLKHKLIQQSNSLPPFDEQTYQDYATNAFELVDIKKEWAHIHSQEPEVNKSDQWLRVLNSLRYIWTDPTRVIPEDATRGLGGEEEDADDDDVKVHGGIIELVCPVSFRKFETPMISTKCHHTFDSNSLDSLFNNQRTIECPMPGCGNTLNRQDFVDDKLMQFRVLISELRKPTDLQPTASAIT